MCRLSNRRSTANTLFSTLWFLGCPHPRTCVEDLLDDHGHLAFQHGVEQLDDQDEAGAEDEE